MRRFLTLFTMLMLCGVLAFAQSRVVTGRVTDNNGKPVPFASIVVKGTRTGIQSDVNGEYTIRVNSGDVLQISQTSYDVVEVPVGSMSNIVTALQMKNNTITEVIVTSAFNTRRTARSTASNVQNVSSEQLNTVRAQNVNNALAGKVAGAQVRSQSAGALGRETTVRLRGENGLGSGGGPIYVVDGTIIPSANDINTDDVEDVTVLQGPAAAALFGPDGANGAIVINTKRARKNAPGMGVEINSGIVFDKIYITPNYQNEYAGGSTYDLIKYSWKPGDPEGWKALDGKYYHDYTDDASWGPRIAGQEYIPWYSWYPGHERSFTTAKLTPQPNNVKNFYNTGVTATNNVSFSKAGDAFNLRASYTNLDVKGIIPNSYLKRNTFNVNLGIDLSKKLTFSTSVNYVQQNRNAENNDSYSNQSAGSFNQWFHRELDMDVMRDMADYKTPEGIYASWNHGNPNSFQASDPQGFYGGNYWFNPYTYFNFVKNIDNRDRIYGDMALTYKFNNEFRVKATYRKNQLTTNGYNLYPTELEQSGSQTSFNPYEGTGKAAYGVFNNFSNRQNYELLGSYTKKVRDFSINANAGLDILRTRTKGFALNTLGGLNVPGLYSLSNSKNTPGRSISTIATGNPETFQEFTRRGVFVRADVGYKNYLFVEGTYRRDYTSAEPFGNSIPTKSVGMSFVFSDLIKNKSVLSFGKLRASTGQTISSLTPYEINYNYAPSPDRAQGQFVVSEPNTLIDPALRGSTNNEKEIGLEARFLKNRVGFNVTYWDRTNKDFPVTVGLPVVTGYTSIRLNAGEIAKNGVDVTVFVTPIRKANIEWNINATWSYLKRNEVVKIAGDIDRLVVASGAFSGSSSAYVVSRVGQPWGQLFGGGIKRINGQPVLGADGQFIKEENVNFGSVLPRYTGGVQNTLTLFKNFVVNVNIDYQSGGKYFSLSDFWGSLSGLTARTATLNDKGNSIRDAVADGGGVHVFGVDETGKATDMYVEAYDYFHQFRAKNISEASVYDLTFVKMRELSVGYNLPMNRIGLGKYIKNATFSIIARNPFLLYSKTRDFDPSEISNVEGEEGQLPGTRSLGFNLKLGF